MPTAESERPAIEELDGPERLDVAWRRARLVVLLLSVVPFAVVLGGQLVWDDRMLTDGTAIGGGRSLLACFTKPFLWHFFRPLVSVSFFFERMLWHSEPLGYHITNLLLHLAGTAVVMALVREAFGSRRAAITAGVLFAAHPVQVGAVAWIGGRTDSLATLWVALMSWMLVRSAKGPASDSGFWLAWAVLYYSLAIYTKEQCLPLLALAPLAFAVWKSESGVRLPLTKLFATIPFAASAALFVTLGWYLGMPRPSTLPYAIRDVLGMAGATIWHYTFLVLMPSPVLMHRLSLDGYARFGVWPAFGGAVVAAAALCSIALLWKRNRAGAWFGCMGLLLYAPVSNLLPLPFLTVAPYRAALPWLGLSCVLAALAAVVHQRLSLERGRLLPALHVGAGIYVAWLISLTVWGSIQWRTETGIFQRFMQYDPQSIVVKSVATYSLERDGRLREAAEVEEKALDGVFGSSAWRASDTAVSALEHDPMVSFRARRNQGTNEDPRIWIAGLYAQLANCRMRAGDKETAHRWLLIGERIWPNHVRVQLGLGYYANLKHDYWEAVRRHQAALSIDPTSAAGHSGLGFAYAQLGHWDEAAAEYAKWRELEPWSDEARARLSEARDRAARASRPP